MNEPRVDERYVSFRNINCFENARKVTEHMLEVLKNEEYMNPYWKKIVEKIPKAYYENDPSLDKGEELLYFVCSNVFYLEELFENAGFEAGTAALRVCELECC